MSGMFDCDLGGHCPFEPDYWDDSYIDEYNTMEWCPHGRYESNSRTLTPEENERHKAETGYYCLGICDDSCKHLGEFHEDFDAEWIRIGKRAWKCSGCEEVNKFKRFSYCPNCGAKMEEGKVVEECT